MTKGLGLGLGCLAMIALMVLVLAVAGMGTYNNLVGRSQAVDAQWSQVENVYQRRADLIPNLVATVQGAATFEKSTLEAVTQARASVGRMQVDPRNLARKRPSRGRRPPAWPTPVALVKETPELSPQLSVGECKRS